MVCFGDPAVMRIPDISAYPSHSPGSGVAGDMSAGEMRALFLDALQKPAFAPAIIELDRARVLSKFIPAIEDMRECRQNRYHHKPVLAHTIEAIENLDELLANPEQVSERYADAVREALSKDVCGVASSVVLRLAVLFHDIGKPAARKVHDSGRVTFYRHDDIGAHLGSGFVSRIPELAPAADAVFSLIKNHLLLGFIARDETASPKSLTRFILKLGDLTPHEVILSIADRRAARGPLVDAENVERHFAAAEAVLDLYFNPPDPPRPPLLTGDDVMRIARIPKGPEVGRMLGELAKARDEGIIESKADAEKWLAEYLERRR